MEFIQTWESLLYRSGYCCTKAECERICWSMLLLLRMDEKVFLLFMCLFS